MISCIHEAPTEGSQNIFARRTLITSQKLLFSQLGFMIGTVYRLKLTNERSTRGQGVRKYQMQSCYYFVLVEAGHAVFLASVCDRMRVTLPTRGAQPSLGILSLQWDLITGRID